MDYKKMPSAVPISAPRKFRLFVLYGVISLFVLYIYMNFPLHRYFSVGLAVRSPIQTYQYGDFDASDVTVVTMYFRLNKSKHSLEDYGNWRSKFFQSATSEPLVIFTDKQSFNELLELAKQSNNSKTFHVCDDIWSLTRMIERERTREYVKLYQTQQYAKDPEKHIHNPDLYAIWNAKPFLMKYASAQNFYKSKLFIYTDIGAFRSHSYPNWPDRHHVTMLGRKLNGRMLFGQISASIHDARSDYIQGTFFAGGVEAIGVYYKGFYELHDEMLDQGIFIGKDQTIMNMYAAYRHPNLSCQLYLSELLDKCIQGFDLWFAYQFYFAAEYTDRNSSYVFDSDRIASVLESTGKLPLCNENTGHYLSDVNTIRCNNGTKKIVIPKCFKCNASPSPSTTTVPLSPSTSPSDTTASQTNATTSQQP